MKPVYSTGLFWCPRCHHRDKLRVGYSWWCDRCEIGGTQTELRAAVSTEDRDE